MTVPDIDDALAGLVRQIPEGMVTTYRALAEALGDPGAVRFVGKWLLGPGDRLEACPTRAEGLPVHRVVHASGEVGRAAGLEPTSVAEMLRAEGVRVVGSRVDPLSRFFFWDFRTDRPLERLRADQVEIARRVRLEPLPTVETVAGLDIAYRGELAVAVQVLCRADGEVMDYVWKEIPIRFPYISTYLTWRELPAFLSVMGEAERAGMCPDVILVDGNGILHPRRAGIATHLGVLQDRPTVGVAKRRLCGEVNTEGMAINEWRPVKLGGEMIGAAVRTGRNRTLFVSPGHRADLRSAVELVLSLTRESSHPEPLAWAHQLATEAAHSPTRDP
jgi:deoxyribonuclease V